MAYVNKSSRDENGCQVETLVKVEVGDTVWFKSDVEQRGEIIEINGDSLTLRNPQGFRGDYLRRATETIEHADDCWL